MLKRLLLILTLLLATPLAIKAQSTTVSGQVTDSGSQAWNNGTIKFTSAAIGQIPITGTLTSTGSYSNISIPHTAATALGDIGCTAQAGNQFSLEASVGMLSVEDMITAQPGLYFPTLRWSNCIPCWTMGAVAFKMK